MKALIVDDEKNIRATLAVCLEAMRCTVATVSTADAALSATAVDTFDVAFVDLRLGSTSGLELIPKLINESPNLAVVMMTAHATIETAIEAIRKGAVEYLQKPFTPTQIEHLVGKIEERRLLENRVATLEDVLKQTVPDLELETSSPEMRAAMEVIWKAAPSEAAILLRGESGTGKNVFARALHTRSPRTNYPFVAVNVATLTEELLVSELFGHVRGAFTGAVRDQQGRVEMADGGTLFLDEIAELTVAAQAKLLRFLQEKKFERLGEGKTRHSNIRVIAATNRDLETMVKAGQFREDLYYRLGVVEVHLPPLRERSEDIVRLAKVFVRFFSKSMGRQTPELGEDAEQALLRYGWPGNVRELRNAVERALVLHSSPLLNKEALPERVQQAASKRPALGGDFTLDQIEQEHIQRVMARKAVMDAAAMTLGIDSSTLWRKRKKFENA